MSTSSQKNEEAAKCPQGLLQECENLWTEIKQISLVRKPPSKISQEPIDTVTKKYLTAALECFEDSIPQGLPDDVMFQQKYVIDRLETRLQEQKELLQLMQTQKKYLLQQIEDRKEDHEKFKAITKALTEASSTRAEAGGITESRYIKTLKSKLETVEKSNQWISQCMGTFIHKHYPRPNQATIPAMYANSQKSYYSLMKIIMNLINQNVNNPHDTYISLDSHYHPMYIELLKECRIAEIHPSTENKIRLLPHIM